MDLGLSVDLPAIESPESRLFGYPTRVADAWTPRAEMVVEPRLSLPAARATIRVVQGSTEMLDLPHWTRNPLRRARRRSAPVDLGDRLVVDCRVDTPTNYCHVIVNMAQRALLLRQVLRGRAEEGQEIVALLRPGAPPFATGVFEALGFTCLVSDRHARGRIVLQEYGARPPQFVFLPQLFPELEAAKAAAPERLLILRRGNRRITNDEEVRRLLEGRGFQAITFEGMSLLEQWAVVRRAKQVVVVHGAGMANLLFNRQWATGEGPSIVEVFPGGFKVDYFRLLAAALRGRWCAVRGHVTSRIVRDLDERGLPLRHAFEDTRVHPPSLAAALDYLG